MCAVRNGELPEAQSSNCHRSFVPLVEDIAGSQLGRESEGCPIRGGLRGRCEAGMLPVGPPCSTQVEQMKFMVVQHRRDVSIEALFKNPTRPAWDGRRFVVAMEIPTVEIYPLLD